MLLLLTVAHSRLSTTHGHVVGLVVYASVCVVILMWTCLVWAERSTPDKFLLAVGYIDEIAHNFQKT